MVQRIVLGILAAMLAACSGSSASGPPSLRTSSTSTGPTVSARSSSAAMPGTYPSGTLVGPWNARLLGGITPGRPSSGDIFAAGDKLYARQPALVRLDPATGAVLAHAPTTSTSRSAVTFAGGYLWQATATSSSSPVLLSRLDAKTLAVTLQVTLPVHVAGQLHLISSVDGTQLYLAADRNVLWIASATGATIRRYDAALAVTAVAVNPEGSRFYVAEQLSDNMEGRLVVLDAGSGTQVDSTQPRGIVDNLVSAARGLWASESNGAHSAELFLLLYGDLSRPINIQVEGGGGAPPTATIVGPTAWLGGIYQFGCADATTGRVWALATPTIKPGGGNTVISDITTSGGHWFADYDGDDGQGIITFTPPPACHA